MAQEKLTIRKPFSQLRVNCKTGDGYEPIYEYQVNKKNQKVLVQTGVKNLYSEIQSYKEECLIENILKRVAIGDMSDFRPDGIYQDITEIPNNLIDAHREMQKLENFWNKLPNEVKNQYHNSLDEFIGEAGSEAWLKNTGLLQGEEVAPVLEAPETTIETPKEVAGNE